MKEPRWLLSQTVLALHELCLAAFGGKPGLRDLSLLESALARAKNLRAYGESVTLHQLAAAVGYGICRNRPFIDGNKRTAFISAAVFLERNGLSFEAPEPEVVRVMNAVAAGQISEQEFASWLRQSAPPKPKR
jgi:death-on-curing protein